MLLARRIIDQAHTREDRKILMLALDWSKAFDSVAPDKLIAALRRFGVPEEFCDAIAVIYRDRQFFVRCMGEDSSWWNQAYGIVQGCPLSPFLFSILMTCLLTDASQATEARFGSLRASVSMTRSIVYADDILLVDIDIRGAQFFMNEIQRLGACYGLSFNDKKLEVLAHNIEGDLLNSAGHPIEKKEKIIYLGSVLSSDGYVHSELGRRIGAASKAFNELEEVWKHFGISRREKLRYFDAYVVSNLLYALQTCWLNESELKRLDGAYCRFLRRIVGIPPAYVSRVSNAEIYSKADRVPARYLLLRRQLLLYGHVARLPNEDVLRISLLVKGSI